VVEVEKFDKLMTEARNIWVSKWGISGIPLACLFHLTNDFLQQIVLFLVHHLKSPRNARSKLPANILQFLNQMTKDWESFAPFNLGIRDTAFAGLGILQ